MENYGAFVDLGNEIEGFLHISELSWQKNINHPSEVIAMGQEIDVEVIELDLEGRKLRVSLKKLQPKPFEVFTQKHKEGDVVKGRVTSIKEFGAFVAIDGVEGLLHNEDASWSRKDKCSDMYQLGDEVEVMIQKIDKERERISLSRKQLTESPVDAYAKAHKNGDMVTGEIRDIKEFGVFVKLADEVDGLIRIEDLYPLKAEELNVGDKIEAVIVMIDNKKGKIRLSVKRLEKQQEREMLDSINQSEDEGTTLGDVLKDALNKGKI